MEWSAVRNEERLGSSRSFLVKLLALQLKRIGDLILTIPALAALRQRFPSAQITLAVTDRCAPLLPALDFIDRALVLRGETLNLRDWAGLIFTKFDICLDFTCNDRSAFCTVLSKAARRVTFEFAKKSRIRLLAYNRLIDSPVREYHTADHYCHLLRFLCPRRRGCKRMPLQIARTW
jgi:heptosyltransferase-3